MAGSGPSTGGEILETARADRGVWLIKVPKLVGDTWKGGGGGGGAAGGGDGGGVEHLGVVRMSVDPLKGPSDSSTEFSFHAAGKGVVSGLPVEFALNRSSMVPMYIFSETPQGKLALEGKVDQKFDLQPKMSDTAYRAHVKNRDKQFNTPKRQIAVWDHSQGGVSMTPLPSSSLRDFRSKVTMRPNVPVKTVDNKRVRMESDALEALVFKLFERQPYWGMRQLMDETQQPQGFLKEKLTALCIYNKRGNHQGMYELKPEYKKHGQDDETSDT